MELVEKQSFSARNRGAGFRLMDQWANMGYFCLMKFPERDPKHRGDYAGSGRYRMFVYDDGKVEERLGRLAQKEVAK